MKFFNAKALIGAAALIGASLNASAIPFQVDITVDNSYALFLGTATAATTFVGSDNSWPTTESYSFNLPASDYIYVVTQSDLAVAQGFLAQFTNLTNNNRFYSNDPQWQVSATGRYGWAPYTGSTADFAELTSQIMASNANSTPSGGWVNTTAGAANGAGPWGSRPGIDAAARWSWYDKKQDGSNPTLGGYNHDEYLIFRINVGSEPTPVPESSGVILFALGLFGLGALRRARA